MRMKQSDINGVLGRAAYSGIVSIGSCAYLALIAPHRSLLFVAIWGLISMGVTYEVLSGLAFVRHTQRRLATLEAQLAAQSHSNDHPNRNGGTRS